MDKCFIFAAVPFEKIPAMPDEKDYVIAADKGVENAGKFGISPDIIIGDFDSLGYVPKGENVRVLPVKKDDTDVGYALKYGLEKGFKSFYVYGALGGRIDHTFANIQLSQYMSRRGAECIFIGDDINITSVTAGSVRFKKAKGRFSVFCTSGKAEGVNISGAEYPLYAAALTPDFPLGVSNMFKMIKKKQ